MWDEPEPELSHGTVIRYNIGYKQVNDDGDDGDDSYDDDDYDEKGRLILGGAL